MLDKIDTYFITIIKKLFLSSWSSWSASTTKRLLDCFGRRQVDDGVLVVWQAAFFRTGRFLAGFLLIVGVLQLGAAAADVVIGGRGVGGGGRQNWRQIRLGVQLAVETSRGREGAVQKVPAKHQVVRTVSAERAATKAGVVVARVSAAGAVEAKRGGASTRRQLSRSDAVHETDHGEHHDAHDDEDVAGAKADVLDDAKIVLFIILREKKSKIICSLNK